MKPFHLSFVVQDKEAAKKFYLEVLGCKIGRDNPTWFDIIFFGHQITIHQQTDTMPAKLIDHFGPILSKQDWFICLESCRNNNVPFVGGVTVKDEGKSNESGKFLIHDPANNILEFKYYLDFTSTVG